MKTKKINLTIFAICLASIGNAQVSHFQKLYSESNQNNYFLNDFISTVDNGALFVGEDVSNNEGIILKTNDVGNCVFQKKIQNIAITKVVELFPNEPSIATNHDFIVVGKNSNPSTASNRLMRLKTNGDVNWSKFFDGSEYRHSIDGICNASDDDNIIITGINFHVDDPLSFTQDFFIAKINANTGEIISHKSFKPTNYHANRYVEKITDIQPLIGGGYIILSNNFLVKMDANLNLLWAKQFHTDPYTALYELAILPNGGFVVTGGSNSIENSIIFFDSNGNHYSSKKIVNYNNQGGADIILGNPIVLNDYIVVSGKYELLDQTMMHFIMYYNESENIPYFIEFGKNSPRGSTETFIKNHLDGLFIASTDASSTAFGGVTNQKYSLIHIDGDGNICDAAIINLDLVDLELEERNIPYKEIGSYLSVKDSTFESSTINIYPEVYCGENVIEWRKRESLNKETALEDKKNDDLINIFPNPTTSGKVNVEFNIKDILSIHITDLSGKIILNKKNITNGVLIVEELPKGMYIINIVSANKIYKKKLVVE